MTRWTHWGTVASFVVLFGTGATLYNHRPRYRVGSHIITLPHIPSWLTISASPKLVHYVFAAAFVLCGIFYFAWAFRRGYFKDLVISRADAAKLIPMQMYYFGLRKEPPSYGRYNPLQKLAYTLVLFVVSPLIVLSGAAMLPIPILQPIGAIFVGGVKFWHVVLMAILSLFVLGHIGMVLSTGFVKNLRRLI
jgi:thiosulfate reductase cytochrome b subunit